MPLNRLDRPVILGIVGDSAAGKTTLAAGVAEILGKDQVVTICTDDYHKYDRAQRAENGTSALDLKCNYLDIIENDLNSLRNGKAIIKPIYSHHDGTFKPAEYVEPKPYIVVEGLLGYSTRNMRNNYDVKIYLDPEEELRVLWKVIRDTTKRGYTEQQVLASLEKRKDDSPAFIQPQRTFADMVIQFYRPEGKENEVGPGLNVRHTLRPTLPHPDLTSLLDVGANKGITLDLVRDNDGKPVDILDIHGSIETPRASKLEELLWTLIPEAQHLRENTRSIEELEKINIISHPLMLTQLLIAYHMVKAALGHHAI
ncbi:MAG: phosphoribulokinase [Proteobacteria bacterium]|jgi:phosphoribulokinase|nr:phosphoribulokinase [Pseudomonadota bacterium]